MKNGEEGLHSAWKIWYSKHSIKITVKEERHEACLDNQRHAAALLRPEAH